MKTTISPRDNVVTIGGESRPIDCSALDKSILSIHFESGSGAVFYSDGRIVGLSSLADYQPVLDAHAAWQPANAAVIPAPVDVPPADQVV